MRRIRWRVFLYSVFLLILFFASAEIALRRAGHEPWRAKETDIAIEPGGKFVTKDLVLVYGMSDKIYKPPPFIGFSSFMGWLDDQYNEIEESLYQKRKIARLLINKFYRLCSENDIEFIVAGIWSDPLTYDMLEYCKEQGIATVDISVELDNETTFRPHDGHPNALAHKKIAYKLIAFLEGFLDGPIVYNPDS